MLTPFQLICKDRQHKKRLQVIATDAVAVLEMRWIQVSSACTGLASLNIRPNKVSSAAYMVTMYPAHGELRNAQKRTLAKAMETGR